MGRAVPLWVLLVSFLHPVSDLVAAATVDGQPRVRDLHSFGNPEVIRVRHIALNLATDFARKELRGKATLTVERLPGADPAAPLILDSRELNVRSVIANGAERRFEIPFSFGEPDEILGTALRIELPAGIEVIEIFYTTSPKATALQWVEPTGTAGGKRPFLYTQSQSIHARSWIPCQDSPGVRVTYDAEIHAPEGLTAVMSAERLDPRGSAQRFTMKDAIPPYLIALAVGDLAFREMGPRTGVWAEPTILAAAAEEFRDTEQMLASAEALFGPYRWGRYDILVLPPSFPFGGMENARVTFATPTVIVGDRSLVALIAHELAHSWSGNLVTNATWRDFWLNEGFTVYLERRIVEAVFGEQRAAMEAVLGRSELEAELAALDDRDEVLHVDLDGRDPDEGFTRVPYEKGALFLRTLEERVGRERFDRFLRAYFDHFAFRSLTTGDFEEYLKAELFGGVDASPLDLEEWLHGPGLPADASEPAAERLESVRRIAAQWAGGDLSASALVSEHGELLDGTMERIQFLTALPERLPAEKLAELDAAFSLTERANPEVAQHWFLLAIRSGYPGADDRIEEFLTRVGRRKYLMPLYQALAATPKGLARARSIYAKARPRYHPIAVSSVDALLGAP